jgi:hypothetical protein
MKEGKVRSGLRERMEGLFEGLSYKVGRGFKDFASGVRVSG